MFFLECFIELLNFSTSLCRRYWGKSHTISSGLRDRISAPSHTQAGNEESFKGEKFGNQHVVLCLASQKRSEIGALACCHLHCSSNIFSIVTTSWFPMFRSFACIEHSLRFPGCPSQPKLTNISTCCFTLDHLAHNLSGSQ
jgi:hypothetical protein